MEIRQRFAIRLRELRKAKGLPQSELGARVGIPQPTISNWEQGKHDPELSAALALAEVFGVTVEELVRVPEGTKFEPPRRFS
jgi:transcriptional regulator with XRE-family HTH domain